MTPEQQLQQVLPLIQLVGQHLQIGMQEPQEAPQHQHQAAQLLQQISQYLTQLQAQLPENLHPAVQQMLQLINQAQTNMSSSVQQAIENLKQIETILQNPQAAPAPQQTVQPVHQPQAQPTDQNQFAPQPQMSSPQPQDQHPQPQVQPPFNSAPVQFDQPASAPQSVPPQEPIVQQPTSQSAEPAQAPIQDLTNPSQGDNNMQPHIDELRKVYSKIQESMLQIEQLIQKMEGKQL